MVNHVKLAFGANFALSAVLVSANFIFPLKLINSVGRGDFVIPYVCEIDSFGVLDNLLMVAVLAVDPLRCSRLMECTAGVLRVLNELLTAGAVSTIPLLCLRSLLRPLSLLCLLLFRLAHSPRSVISLQPCPSNRNMSSQLRSITTRQQQRNVSDPRTVLPRPRPSLRWHRRTVSRLLRNVTMRISRSA